MLTVQFRTELLLYAFTTILPIVVWLFAWKSILGDASVAGFSFETLVGYYVLSVVIRLLTRAQFENVRVEEIRNGKIDYFLTKPIAYFYDIWWKKLGGDVALWVWTLPATIVGTWLVLQSFELSLVSSAQTWLLFAGFLIFGYLVEFGLSYLVTLMGFWLEWAEGLQHFKWFAIATLSGNAFPIQFMPEILQPVMLALPFRYLYQVPIELMLGRATPSWLDGVGMLAALAVLWLINLVIWKAAMRRYASSGG